MVDFFVADLWGHIPAEWTQPLEALETSEILQLPSGFMKDEWPESLKDFIRTAHGFSLQKKPLPVFRSDVELMNELKRGFTEKKRHEVSVLAPAIANVAGALGIKHLVDIGSGQGYLSNVLAHRYGFHVIGIDSSEHNIQASSSKSQQVHDEFLKKGIQSQGSYTGITAQVNAQSNLSELQKMVTESMNHSEGNPDESAESSQSGHKPSMLIGLHCCGDLTSSMLRLFANGQGDALFQFSCCFHLITEEVDYATRESAHESHTSTHTNARHISSSVLSQRPDELGFPLTKTLKEKDFALGRRARLLACQCTDRWPHEMAESERQQALNNIIYRSVIEKILRDHYPQLYSSPAASVGFVPLASARSEYPLVIKNISAALFRGPFADYAHFVLTKRFKFDLAQDLSVLHMQKVYDDLALQRHRAVIFWALKCVLSPVVEGIILVDRVAFLQQRLSDSNSDSDSDSESHLQGSTGFGDCVVVPVLDPVISPRSFGILAVRSGSVRDLLDRIKLQS